MAARRCYRILALFPVLVAGACGSATPSATAPPTIKQAAATAYETATAAANKAIQAAWKPCPTDGGAIAAYEKCYSDEGAAEKAFSTALAAITFPPEAKAHGTSLTGALTQTMASEKALAASPDPDHDYADADALKKADVARVAAAATVAQDLSVTGEALAVLPPPTVRQAAAAAYLALVTPINAQETALSGACKSFTTVAQWHACYGPLSALDTQVLQGLYAIQMPLDMKTDVSAAIAAWTKNVAGENGLAKSADPSHDFADYNAAGGGDVAATSGVLRHDLGLQAVPLT